MRINRANKSAIIMIVLLITLFIIAAIYSSKKTTEKWENIDHFKFNDSVNIKVIQTNYLRGYLSFNDSVYIIDAELKFKSIELCEVAKIEKPFLLYKTSENDAIYIK